jgi:hypothetical protein
VDVPGSYADVPGVGTCVETEEDVRPPAETSAAGRPSNQMGATYQNLMNSILYIRGWGTINEGTAESGVGTTGSLGRYAVFKVLVAGSRHYQPAPLPEVAENF